MKTFGTLKYVKGAWELDVPPHVVLRLKRVFPKVNRKHHGTIRLSDSPEIARELEWFMGRYPLVCVDSATSERLQQQSAKHRDQESLVEQILSGARAPTDFKLALPLRDYQSVAVDLLVAVGGLLVGDDVGLGKTPLGIALSTRKDAQPALVVTLTHLTTQWADEFQKFAPGLRTHVLKKASPYDLGQPKRGRGKKGQLWLDDGLQQLNSFPDVIITNYHKLSGWAETLAPLIKSVTFDEVAELRHGKKSQKGAASYHLAKDCAYRLGLSATPIFNLGSEIWAVVEALRPGALGSRDEFIEEWCKSPDSRGNAELVDPAAFGTYLRDAGLMIRRTRAELGRELPPVTQSIQHMDADPEPLKRAQNPAEELARIILSEAEMARGEKFQASGRLEELVRQATGLAKAPAVAEFARMIIESGEQLVIYGWHHAVYDLLAEKLKEFKPVLYTGEQSATQKEAAKQAFISGESRVILMSLRSGLGLNGLQDVCSICLFAELDWSPAVHHQAIGRLARDGQLKPVLAYYALTDCGTDPVIAEVLQLKKIQSAGIVDPKGEILESVDASGEHGRRIAELYIRRNAA